MRAVVSLNERSHYKEVHGLKNAGAALCAVVYVFRMLAFPEFDTAGIWPGSLGTFRVVVVVVTCPVTRSSDETVPRTIMYSLFVRPLTISAQ